MTQQSTALAERNGQGGSLSLAPQFRMSLDDLAVQVKALAAFKEEIMDKGTDYDVIPGTLKPSLLKPGAEKLAQVFQMRPVFAVTSRLEDWERGFFQYEVDCTLISKQSGETVGNGLGSANSKESRYRWRNVQAICPACGHDLMKSKQNPEWFCWAKKGGCGATFPLADIQAGGRVENDDPYTLVNTLLKMAQKRALIAAVLVATAASGIFTQDVEDMDLGPRAVYPGRPLVDEAADEDGEAAGERFMREGAARLVGWNGGGIGAQVTKPRDPVWLRWGELCEEADKRGIEYPPFVLPIQRSELIAAGKELALDIAAARAGQDEDQPL